MGSERERHRWRELADLGEIVIVDSPATAPLPDTTITAASADATVLVLIPSTKRHAARAAVTMLARAGAPVVGVIRNREAVPAVAGRVREVHAEPA